MEKSSKLQVIGLAVAGLGMAVTTQTMAAGPTISGLIQADYAAFRGKPQDGFVDSGTIRRADLSAAGNINNFWGYNLTYRFSSAQLRNAWISYKAFKPLQVQFGQYDTVYTGLENSSGAASSLFIPATSVNQLWSNAAPVIGLRGMGSVNAFSYQVGAWVPGTASTTSFSSTSTTGVANSTLSGRDPWGFSARVTAAPIKTDSQVVHLGLSYQAQGLSNNLTQVQIVPVVARSTPALVQDSDYFKRYNVWGLEGAAIMGPFYGQAEYQRAHYKALPVGANTLFNIYDRYHDSWYAQFSYVITGESHTYDGSNGTVGNVKPRSQFGAWEVAVRYDTANLRQRAQTLSGTAYGDVWPGYTSTGSGVTFAAAPGILRDWTAGVTYYATQSVKFQLNYSDAHANYLTPLSNKRVHLWAFRGQVQF